MRAVLLVLAVLLILGLVWLAPQGLMTKPTVAEETVGPYWMVYQEVTGDYRNTPVAMDAVYDTLVERGIETTHGVGLYLDNPASVAKEALRSHVGCLVDSAQYAAVMEAVGFPYSTKKFAARSAHVARFPLRGQMSYMFGAIKAYKALGKVSEEEGLSERAMMEIYDVPGEEIRYILPDTPFEESTTEIPPAMNCSGCSGCE